SAQVDPGAHRSSLPTTRAFACPGDVFRPQGISLSLLSLDVQVLSQIPADTVRETAPVGDLVDAFGREGGPGDRIGDLDGTPSTDDSAEEAPIVVVLRCVSEPVFEAETECGRGRHLLLEATEPPTGRSVARRPLPSRSFHGSSSRTSW